MYALSTLAFVSLCAQLVLAQKNITVVDTDPSIQYQGGAGDALICKVNADGTFVGGQGGCYNIPSECTTSVAMGQSQDSGASFKFKGSAIYINSVLFDLSPLYTVTLDGTATDVDGFRQSKPFLCETLFSKTGLDPTTDHTISLTIKSQSPNRTSTADASIFDFSLINFIYTTDDSTSSSITTNTIDTASSTATTPTNTDGASTNTNTASNDTKTSSSTSIRTAIAGLHGATLGALMVAISMLLSGTHML